MSRDRLGFWLPCTALFVSAVGARREPSRASSIAPLPRQLVAPPLSRNSLVGSEAGGSSGSGGGSGAVLSGSRSEPLARAAPSEGAASAPVAGTAIADGPRTGAHPIPAGDTPLPLVDAEGKPLPQTEARPSTSTTAFRKRVEAVAGAIISGDAEPALASFFPLVAYAQVKDVAKPERDYKFRLLANFKRDVLEYHHALGAAAAEAKFSGVTVSERDTKWMAPGSEGNKLGYFRVLRSHLHFTLPAGRSRDFELTSLISWRGEWYVVHLHGFK